MQYATPQSPEALKTWLSEEVRTTRGLLERLGLVDGR